MHTKKRRESIQEVFQASPFVWLSDGKLWSSSSKAAVYGGAGSSPAVGLRRFEGLVA